MRTVGAPKNTPTPAMRKADRSLREMMETVAPFTKPRPVPKPQQSSRWVSGETSGLPTPLSGRQR